MHLEGPKTRSDEHIKEPKNYSAQLAWRECFSAVVFPPPETRSKEDWNEWKKVTFKEPGLRLRMPFFPFFPFETVFFPSSYSKGINAATF
ncbi:hypothetical protein CEXT_262701 [Caerostris extrusa]|uniref:Uncharacterized protein n=1 Tax=Caerostris extrusa TaxID=172846 RepID=A0AAV4QVE9_CAEEX|nr:hypothetical protein CEXT_262701 [Caerostris extrusa]